MTNKTTTDVNREWDATQVRDFVKTAKARVDRGGWALLVPELRIAIVKAEAVSVVMRQSGSVNAASVGLLVSDMLDAAGLGD